MAKRRSVGANWSGTVQGSRRRGYVETPRGSAARIRGCRVLLTTPQRKHRAKRQGRRPNRTRPRFNP